MDCTKQKLDDSVISNNSSADFGNVGNIHRSVHPFGLLCHSRESKTIDWLGKSKPFLAKVAMFRITFSLTMCALS